MNCEEYWNNVGALPAERLAAHLAECRSCAARWAAEGSVVAGLRLLGADEKDVSAPPRLEARLLRAYREQYGRRVSRTAGAHRWWAAAAAVLLAAAGLWTGAWPSAAPARGVSGAAVLAGMEESQGAFIPLPNAAGVTDDDELDLVRVELPRSAMTALGLAAGDENLAGSVEAEVLVGPDGMARAVRFLN